MDSAGSTWQMWDLHVHTPASFHWSDGHKFGEPSSVTHDAACKAVLDKMNDLDVVAFGIMDYWTFEGYLTLQEYLKRNPAHGKKAIFPGIELRMEAATEYRLNTHVLISDDAPDDDLRHFVSHLKMPGPDGKPPTRQNFIDLGRGYDPGKLRKHGFALEDRAVDEKMLQLGMMTAIVTRDSILAAMKVVGEENCLLIQPYDTSDGLDNLDWEKHPHIDSALMKWAHCFETRSQFNVDLFLGFGSKKKPTLGPEFIENLGGSPKPVFSGSDAHKVADYGVYPSQRITWLKAQPTFHGLKQVCHEPSLRCFIGKQPPKLAHVVQNPTKYIRSIALAKIGDLEEQWFDGEHIELNPGLIAIIGNKGSGKSALADIIALAGNTHCKDMEFLNDNRFRHSGAKAKHFRATLVWSDGSANAVTLSDNANTLEPERIRYLPQHYIEKLCNEIAAGNHTEFARELKKVIFSHVPEEKQLGHCALDELLEYQVAPHRKSIALIQQKIAVTNENIFRNEDEISEDSLRTFRTTLTLKQGELDAHVKAPPEEVPKPVDDPTDAETQARAKQIAEKQEELAALEAKLEEAKIERTTEFVQAERIKRLTGHIDNLVSEYDSFVEDNAREFEDGGFVLDQIVTFKVDRQPLLDAADKTNTRVAELNLLIDGKPAEGEAPVVNGLETTIAECKAAILKIQDGLKAPEKAWQAYQAELAKWTARRVAMNGTVEKPDTILYLQERIRRATEFLPAELERLRQERRDLVRELHTELVAIRAAHEELYKPVQSIASKTEFSTDSMQLEFNAFLNPTGFTENFLEFINKGRRGTFYGDEESRKHVDDLLKKHDFNSTDSVVVFVDAIMKALTGVEREGQPREEMSVKSQLKNNKKVTDLYDFVFGLKYLEPLYTLRLGKKDITQLSPGEKGALLLVFYLLLDTEEIPIIIDQPEHNLDNESVVKLLVDCIRRARDRRQVMIVTHNPNLAVVCDADQVICCKIDKTDKFKISYTPGAIEDYPINKTTVDVLEGTYRAFDNRRRKYHKPVPELLVPPPAEQPPALDGDALATSV